MTTRTWGGSAGNWNEAANWSPSDSAPQPGDTAILLSGTAALGGNSTTLGNLTLFLGGSGGTLSGVNVTFDAASQVHVTGTLGAIAGQGLTTNQGSFLLNAELDLTQSAAGTIAADFLNTNLITISGGWLNDKSGPVTNNGTIDVSAGKLTTLDDLNGAGTVLLSGDPGSSKQGVVEIQQHVSGQTFDFLNGLATLTLGSSSTVSNVTLNDFQPGDTIDIGETIAAGQISVTNGTLSVPGYVFALTHTLGPNEYTTADFAVSGDGTGGTFITTTHVPCFRAGTRIRTIEGDVTVETLREGSRVVTSGGEAVPVVWLGQREIDCRRHPYPEQVWPIRVRAGAIGPGLPARDLYLSPDHAVFVDGVLIPIKHLLNATSIAQVRTERVSYWHVELPRHDILLAEGLPAESYLDTGDRARFRNGGMVTTLHPDFASRIWDATGCAPLVVTGPAIAAVRRRLAARVITRRRDDNRAVSAPSARQAD